MKMYWIYELPNWLFGTLVVVEAGTDAFTIMRLAGHSSVTVSQRYIHPTPESMERAFDRFEAFNKKAMERANRWRVTQTPPPACTTS